MDDDTRPDATRLRRRVLRWLAYIGVTALMLCVGCLGWRVFRVAMGIALEEGAWLGDLQDGRRSYGNGDYAVALPLLADARWLMPSHWWYAPRYAATCGMLGDCYLYSDQPELAEAAYRRALKSGKKDAQVYFALARASAAMGNAEATADMLVKAVGLDPTIARLAVTDPYLRKLPARPTPPPSKEGDEPANRADRR